MAHEWKKAEKKFYLPNSKPEYIQIPPFKFFSIEGNGDPNDESFGDYIGVLYSLSYAVKMSPKKGLAPENYFEYTVYPLEGVWDISEEAKKKQAVTLDKSSLVNAEFAEDIIHLTKKKKPHPLLDNVIFNSFEEGQCIQMLHTGSYDNEPASFKIMEDFCVDNKFTRESKKHREIYISDARRVSADKLKTVLRFKIL